MVSQGRDRRTGGQIRRAGVVIAIVLALAFVVAQTSPLVRSAIVPVRAGMDDIVVQSAAGVHRSSGWGFGGDADLRQKIEALEIENRQLSIWRDTATSMSERMLRYEELLNLQGEPIPSGISARVVTETNGPFAETRLANAGDRNGVMKGFIAVNTRGVVGRVVRVGNRSSRILLVTDFNSRVPVMGEVSGVRAILAGGRGKEIGQLIDKPERADFIEGENLITTGEGNAFPRGLRLGVVFNQNGEWVAQLALSEAPLDFVRLLPSLAIPAPEAEVAEVETEAPVAGSVQ